MAAGLGRRAGPAPGTDDWHADRPAVVAAGARAGVKEKMAARARHRGELPGQVAVLQQMRQRSREVCAELERRSRGSGGSWWEPEKSERQEEQEAEEMQQLTEELQTLEVQVAAVHPKVKREAERLQNMAQLAALGQDHRVAQGGGAGRGMQSAGDQAAQEKAQDSAWGRWQLEMKRGMEEKRRYIFTRSARRTSTSVGLVERGGLLCSQMTTN